MSMNKIFDIAGSAMSAQSVRLNLVSSNLANADSVAATPEEAYRSRHAVFRTVLEGQTQEGPGVGVEVAGIVEGAQEPMARYQPGHPLADEEGYVWGSNVDPVQEMVDMISASRTYQSNVEVMSTTKDLMLKTLRLGQ